MRGQQGRRLGLGPAHQEDVAGGLRLLLFALVALVALIGVLDLVLVGRLLGGLGVRVRNLVDPEDLGDVHRGAGGQFEILVGGGHRPQGLARVVGVDRVGVQGGGSVVEQDGVVPGRHRDAQRVDRFLFLRVLVLVGA